MSILTNQTPYGISYLVVHNVKREIAIIGALLAVDAIPFIGWAAAVANSAYIAKNIVTLARVARAVQETLAMLRVLDDALDETFIRVGHIPSGQSQQWFGEGMQTCEFLLQFATFYDQRGNSQSMGWSAIVEPARRDYESRMDKVYFNNGEEAGPWGGIGFNVLQQLQDFLDWMQRIIRIIRDRLGIDIDRPENLRAALTRRHLENVATSTEFSSVMREFQSWYDEQGFSQLRETFNAPIQLAIEEERANIHLNINRQNSVLEFITICNQLTRHPNYIHRNIAPLAHPPWPAWNGLSVVIKVPPANTTLPVPIPSQPKPMEFIKATGPERNNPNNHNLVGKGITIFLEAGTSGRPVYIPVNFQVEAIHVHLPSLRDPGPPARPCQNGTGYSYWLAAIQPNDLSGPGWCVNIQYNNQKYKLQNDRDIFCVDKGNVLLPDLNQLQELGRNNQQNHALLSHVLLSRDRETEQSSPYFEKASFFPEAGIIPGASSNERREFSNARKLDVHSSVRSLFEHTCTDWYCAVYLKIVYPNKRFLKTGRTIRIVNPTVLTIEVAVYRIIERDYGKDMIRLTNEPYGWWNNTTLGLYGGNFDRVSEFPTEGYIPTLGFPNDFSTQINDDKLLFLPVGKVNINENIRDLWSHTCTDRYCALYLKSVYPGRRFTKEGLTISVYPVPGNPNTKLEVYRIIERFIGNDMQRLPNRPGNVHAVPYAVDPRSSLYFERASFFPEAGIIPGASSNERREFSNARKLDVYSCVKSLFGHTCTDWYCAVYLKIVYPNRRFLKTGRTIRIIGPNESTEVEVYRIIEREIGNDMIRLTNEPCGWWNNTTLGLYGGNFDRASEFPTEGYIPTLGFRNDFYFEINDQQLLCLPVVKVDINENIKDLWSHTCTDRYCALYLKSVYPGRRFTKEGLTISVYPVPGNPNTELEVYRIIERFIGNDMQRLPNRPGNVVNPMIHQFQGIMRDFPRDANRVAVQAAVQQQERRGRVRPVF